jgi:uncharacterized protein (DUF952 family)
MTRVFKICQRAEWDLAAARGTYEGSAADHRDGFIHLSAADQLPGTLERHFAGQEGLVLIAFDDQDLAALRWEPSRGGALFPHVYGPLPVSRARWVKDLPHDRGRHRLPEGLDS